MPWQLMAAIAKVLLGSGPGWPTPCACVALQGQLDPERDTTAVARVLSKLVAEQKAFSEIQRLCSAVRDIDQGKFSWFSLFQS
jgi:hypothetical protein